jgi:hypothetical protein
MSVWPFFPSTDCTKPSARSMADVMRRLSIGILPNYIVFLLSFLSLWHEKSACAVHIGSRSAARMELSMSSEALDWLAGSVLHNVYTRSCQAAMPVSRRSCGSGMMVLAGISNVLARQKEGSAFLGRVDHSQSVESPVVTWNASWTHVAETLGQLHPLRVLALLACTRPATI